MTSAHVRLTPEVYVERIPGQYYRVKQILAERALVMLQELPAGGATSWSFDLRPVGPGRMRLVVRGRSSSPSSLGAKIARRIELVVLEPGYFVMERGMLRGIRKRAESAARASP